ALPGAGDGVAPPAQPPDALAALVGQGVIDQQGDAAQQRQPGEDEDADAVGQPGRRPGGALEEVVKAIQAVSGGVVGADPGVGGMGDASQRGLAQTHDPCQQDLAASGEGGGG